MTRSKLSFRPRASVLALEPRVLFDGAGAMAAVDYLADVPAKTESAKEVEAEKTPATAAPVTLASPRAEDAGISRVGTDSVITTVLIVDTRVADYASLLAGLPANAVLRVVDSGESGLNAVSQALAGLQGIESVQIISHGTPGSFTLGSDTVDAASVAAHGAQLQAWAGHLTADADILLYGCDVGQGAQGQALLTQLAALTGADIAASTNATGAAAKGGDWVLERNTGAIEAGLAVRERNFSLTHVYGADEAFCTGTFAGVAPVGSVDGRVLGTERGPVVERLQHLYRERIARDVGGRSRP